MFWNVLVGKSQSYAIHHYGNVTLNRLLGEGTGLGNGLGDGLGEGLGNGLLNFLLLFCSSSSSVIVSAPSVRMTGTIFSLVGIGQVSDVFRDTHSPHGAAFLAVSASIAARWASHKSLISLLSLTWSSECYKNTFEGATSYLHVIKAAEWPLEPGPTSSDRLQFKSRHVTVGLSFRAAAKAIKPANWKPFFRRSTRCRRVPLARHSAKDMIPPQVRLFSCKPKWSKWRFFSNPLLIKPTKPSSVNLLWPKFNVCRLWFVAYGEKESVNANHSFLFFFFFLP